MLANQKGAVSLDGVSKIIEFSSGAGVSSKLFGRIEIENGLIVRMVVGTLHAGCSCDFINKNCKNKERCVRDLVKCMNEADKDLVLCALNETMANICDLERDERMKIETMRFNVDAILKALNVACWINSYDDVILGLIEHISSADRDSAHIEAPFDLLTIEGTDERQTIRKVLWEMLVIMFGKYGTSPKYGWIENQISSLAFLKRLIDKNHRNIPI